MHWTLKTYSFSNCKFVSFDQYLLSVMEIVIIVDTLYDYQFTSFQLLSRVQLFATPWIAAHQASLSITNSRSSLRLTSIESVMPSSHLILCRPLLLLLPVPPSIRVFSNESTHHMRWPKYWLLEFFFSIGWSRTWSSVNVPINLTLPIMCNWAALFFSV